MNLLVIDWDYFFPDKMAAGQGAKNIALYDWGHREAPLFIHDLWPLRAEAFLLAGESLPSLTGEQDRFWERFRFSKQAGLYYAESNAWAIHPTIAKRYKQVWLYDAHHDGGYSQVNVYQHVSAGQWECGDWMIYYKAVAGSQLHVRYPRWKTWAFEQEPEPQVEIDRAFDDFEPNPVVFDRVFVCRSGAWVPSWTDAAFHPFLVAAGLGEPICLDDDGVPDREFDLAEVTASAQANKVRFAGRLTAVRSTILRVPA